MRGLVPAGGSPAVIQKENLILAGDAAGHVMATSGGGIPLAIVAGRIAGEVAAGYLKGECWRCKDYQSRIREEFGRELDEIGADKKDGGCGHEERSAHGHPLRRPKPRSDEIGDACPDSGRSGHSSRTVGRPPKLKAV